MAFDLLADRGDRGPGAGIFLQKKIDCGIRSQRAKSDGADWCKAGSAGCGVFFAAGNRFGAIAADMRAEPAPALSESPSIWYAGGWPIQPRVRRSSRTPTENQAMTKKNRYGNRPTKPPRRRDAPAPIARAAPQLREKKVPAQYGRPFIVLEDGDKNTFKYQNGAWIPDETNIAQYRLDSQVKQLSQQINSMTRYEVRSPLPVGA